MDSAALGSQLDAVFEKLSKAFEGLTSQMQELGKSLQGMAMAGLLATVEGAKLTYVWTLLARSIASIFLPVIHTAISGIMALTEWFRSLSGEGQSIAMNMGLVAVGFKALLPLFGMLKGLLSPIGIVLGLVMEALMQFFTGTDEGKFLLKGLSDVMGIFTVFLSGMGEVFKVVVDALVVAFQWLYRAFVWVAIKIAGLVETILDWIPGLDDAAKSVKQWRENAQANLDAMVNKGVGADPKVNKEKKRNDVTPTGFGFEGLAASFERITTAANKVDLAKETLDVQKQQLVAQNKIWESIEKNGSDGGTGGGDYAW